MKGTVKIAVLETLRQIHCTSELASPCDNQCAYIYICLLGLVSYGFANLHVLAYVSYNFNVNLFTVEPKTEFFAGNITSFV